MGGGIVRKWPHASGLVILPHFIQNGSVFILLGVSHNTSFEQNFSCAKFGENSLDRSFLRFLLAQTF